MFPDTRAGARERIGFIEAFVIGPANMASNKITAPTAMAAIVPTSLLPVETFIITTIKKNVSMSSKTKALYGSNSSAGKVLPNVSLVGNKNHNKKQAKKAPMA